MKEYKNFVLKAEEQLQKRGWSKSRILNAFGKSDEGLIQKVLVDLYETYSCLSIVYYKEDEELLELKEYSVPDSIREFYREFEPKELDYLADGVGLFDLNRIKEANSNDPLGASLIKYGLLTFARTIGGNLICMDLNEINDGEPRVVYVDHTWFHFNEKERKLEKSRFSFKHERLPENEKWVTLDMIKKYLPQISNTFSGFLDKLASDENWDLEDFYHQIGNVLLNR